MQVRIRISLLLGIGLLLALFCTDGFAQSNIIKKDLPGFGEVEYFEGEILIRFRDHVQAGDIERLKEEMAIRYDREYETLPMRYMESESTVEELLLAYRGHPDIQYIQPNFVYRLIEPVERNSQHTSLQSGEGRFPNDPQFVNQWGLHNEGQAFAFDNLGNEFSGTPGADIRAPLAWELTTGSEDVIIAVFDSGIDYNHPDIAENMFTDSNGFFGIDTSPGTDSPNDPMDTDGHGTHVAGIIGAIGNNGIGVSGVNWNVRLMAVRIFNDNNESSTQAIINGFDYALANGAEISNHSYGALLGEGQIDLAQRDKFAEAAEAGHLTIAAAGNDGNDNDDFPKMFPASYDLDNMISVTATDADDELAGFSNFGKNSVHLAAPGTIIRSTFLDGDYRFLSGTSMATPYVTGVAGLIKSVFPDATYTEIRERLLNNSDRLESLQELVLNASRLNAFTSVIEDDGIPPDAVADLNTFEFGQKFVDMQWTAVGYSGDEGRVRNYDLRISQNTINEGNFEEAEAIGDDIFPALAGDTQKFKIGNLEPGTTYYLAIKSEDFFGNRSEISNVVQITLQSPPLTQLNINNINVNLSTGDILDGSFQISNNGTGPLQMEAEGRFRPVTLFDPENRKFPYSFNTNLNESAPELDLVDTRGRREAILFSNPGSGLELVQLPFSFPFFGKDRDSLYVSVNGFVTFGEIDNTDATNTNRSLPNTLAPKDMIAVHWANLAMSSSSLIFKYHDEENDRFIIEWERMTRNPPSVFGNMNIRFQLILYQGGAITMQYRNLESSVTSITAGLNDATGENGFQFSFNDNNLENDLAVTFTPGLPDWFEIESLNLNIQPGESEIIDYRINASGLPAGTFFTELFFLDNDTERVNRIPVEVHVDGAIAEASFYNASIDPDLQRLDVFVNGQLLKHDLQFNKTSEKVKLPAGIDLDITVFNENSGTIENPVISQNITFPVSQELFVVAAGFSGGFSEPTMTSATPDFKLFVEEIEEMQVEEEKVRLLFFNAIADVDNAGLVGFFRDRRPPFVISENIPFGTFSQPKTIFKDNFDVDAVEGPELLKSFNMNLSNNGGETIAAVLTGFSGISGTNGELSLIYTNFKGLNRQAPRTTVPGGSARHIPDQFELEQNFPNPFNPVTQIQFSIPDQRDVRVDIYDVLGRRIQTLVNETRQAGIHRIEFDGSTLSSGVYFYRIQAGGEVQSKKMMLVK